MSTVDEVVAAHPVRKETTFWRYRLVCDGCGATSPWKLKNGMWTDADVTIQTANHWADLAGISKWRKLK